MFKKQVEDDSQAKLDRLDVEDKLYPCLLESINQTKAEKLEAIEAFEKQNKKGCRSFFNKKSLIL